MLKPGDLFVGVVELFSIVLPGGLLTFVLFQKFHVFFLEGVALSPNQYWAAFLFFSYLTGHIVFMIGARIDVIYNFHRRARNPFVNESGFRCTSAIKKKYLSETECGSINNYQWAISVLTSLCPDAMKEIDQLVASSKFFRSLLVIIPLISGVFILDQHYIHALIVMSGIAPCYLRYYDQRLKSTTRAYQYIVMFSGLGKLKFAE